MNLATTVSLAGTLAAQGPDELAQPHPGPGGFIPTWIGAGYTLAGILCAIAILALYRVTDGKWEWEMAGIALVLWPVFLWLLFSPSDR